MWQRMAIATAGILIAGLVVSACGASSTVSKASSSSATTATSQATTATQVQKADLYLVVLTGKMLQKPGWPAVYPADFTVPGNTDVTVTVRNYDDGTAPVTATYGKVTGTVGGSEQVNGKTVTSIDPAQVSHTITVNSLSLNIPIPPATSNGPSVVVFTFHTPAKGTYIWQCMAPCGSGTDGWGGAMMTDGWMKGTITVSA